MLKGQLTSKQLREIMNKYYKISYYLHKEDFPEIAKISLAHKSSLKPKRMQRKLYPLFTHTITVEIFKYITSIIITTISLLVIANIASESIELTPTLLSKSNFTVLTIATITLGIVVKNVISGIIKKSKQKADN